MTRFDRLSLLAVTALAALLRLPGIAARGTFDADQGHDMLVLRAFTHDGVIPLLGPKTSVGDFHHGAFYYFLLAPASAVSNADPVVVTAWFAILGIAAVALTWWLAREIGGSLAGLVAGLLLAVSPAAVEQSTFIWNPNPIALFAVLSLAAAWRAHSGGRAAWWALAIGAAGAVTQLHVLGVVFLVAILVLALLDLRRAPGNWRGIVGGLGLVALVFLPLAAHELQTGFLETRLVFDYLRAGDPAITTGGPLGALAFTILRVVGWPFVGLVTDVPIAAALVLAFGTGLVSWRLVTARGPSRTAIVWLVGILLWSAVRLASAAPSLQRVVPGLPNDHYHAFLDPIVIILVAVSTVGLFERAIEAWRSTRETTALIGGASAGAALGLLVAAAVLRQPPAIAADGGWVAARDAGERIVLAAAGQPVVVTQLPGFKLPDGIVFPIVHAGGRLLDASTIAGTTPTVPDTLVVVCDRLFEAAIGAACGGAAEDASVADASGGPSRQLLVRFNASSRTSISVYGP